MSAQTIAFPSDVSSVCVNENLVLVGLQDGSVSCISRSVNINFDQKSQILMMHSTIT